MYMKRYTKIVLSAVLMMTLLTVNGFAAEPGSKAPKYVFYFIGDGLGASQRQFAEFFLQEQTNDASQELLMNTFDVAGINTTYAANTLITDSAAAGTALATGEKTNKGVIAEDPQGKDLKTLIEEAEDAGLATGIITTTRLTHATPAAFAAHEITRNNENEIAADFVDSGVDFFAGGGVRHFLPQNWEATQEDSTGTTIKSKRVDDRNLIEEFESLGYATYYGSEGAKRFNEEDMTEKDQVFAAFTYSHMPYEIDRVHKFDDIPSIADMTQAGIEVLSKNQDGFFMMIEGGRIDHACHANDAVGAIYDTLAFDDAIAKAYNFYLAHPEETLIVVVGDHETGGMGLGMDKQGYFLDMSRLTAVTASIEDNILYTSPAYEGDREAFLSYVSKHYGLADMNAEERATIEKGMNEVDAGNTFGYYEYNAAGMAVAHVISERANINWTTTIHTATAIPMTAKGVGAEKFAGYKDNTEIAQAMADLLGFDMK